MKRTITLITLNTMIVFLSFTKDIRMHNVTQERLYTAAYYRPFLGDKPAKRKQPVVMVDAFEFAMVPRPKQHFKSNRHIVVAYSEQDLPEKMDKKVFDELCSAGIGTSTVGRIFDDFYVIEKKNKLKLYDPITLKMNDIKDTVLKNVKTAFDGYRFSLAKHASIVTDNKYHDEIAQLRISDQICEQEQRFLDARLPKVREALEQLLGTKLSGSYIPKIAIVNSGGGARALISCTGFHEGADKMGLLDAVTYDVGLSGGAWFVALWMYSGQDILTFKKQIQPLLEHDLLVTNPKEAKLFADALMVRYGLGQPVTLVNSWGALIANRYLSLHEDKRHQVLWSDVAEYIQDASVPFPILSATSGYLPESFENRPKVPWVEFTPYEVGGVGDWLGNAFVPTWGFGRKFEGCCSVDVHPALDLGGVLGICGSAFAFSFARGYDKEIKELPFIGALTDRLLSKLDQHTQYAIGKKRFTVGKVNNFAKDIPDIQVTGERHLKMVDGGISFNLPYPPISGHGARKADIIILCDASSSIERKGPTNLYMIERYAREHGLKFPTIDTRRVAQRKISVFKDESDPDVPVVIYLPRIAADDVEYSDEVPENFSTSFSTSKFAYSKKQFDALSAVTRTNILSSKEAIIKEIYDHIERNGGF